MPITVADVATLEKYLEGVMNRSEHHAETVGAVALALLGAVLWSKDDGSPLEVRTYAGQPANIVRFKIGGKRYLLAYNHRGGCIELRTNTQTGRVRQRFTNDTSVVEVRDTFLKLKRA